MNLDAALASLANDCRRSCGGNASNRINELLHPLVQRQNGLVEMFSEVTGSTARDTHLSALPDFDVGLLRKTDTYDSIEIVDEISEKLAKAILGDLQLVKWLCFTHQLQISDIQKCFLGGPIEIRDQRTEEPKVDLVVAKYKARDVGLLDIAVGRAGTLLIGLLYHKAWRKWLDETVGAQHEVQRRRLMEVCLFKILASDYGAYGRGGGGLSSAGCEQLLLRYCKQPGAERSLISALAADVRGKKHPKELLVTIPISVSEIRSYDIANEDILKEFNRGVSDEALVAKIDFDQDRIVRPAVKSLHSWRRLKKLLRTWEEDEDLALSIYWRQQHG